MNDERVSGKELEAIRHRLSERDLAVLHAVGEHQFMTTRQITRLYFHAHQSEASGVRAAIRVVSRLLDLRVLTRLERAVGGVRAGSSAYVWCLDSLGDRLIRESSGRSRRRFFQPSLTFLGHKLAVAETRVVIEETARRDRLEVIALDIEMRTWRPYLGRGGETIHLKPDIGLITATSEHEDHWFIEVDRGSESFRTLLDKCAIYETYRRTGREQATRGIFPRVLWIMPTKLRAELLRDHIASTKSLETRLFIVIEPDQLAATITELGPEADHPRRVRQTGVPDNQLIPKGGKP
jgi:hypothetical protein